MNRLDTSIQYIKGVGPQRSRTLSKLGIKTVSDILYYLPFRYEDRSNFTTVSDARPGSLVTIKGVVTKMQNLRTRSGINIFQLVLDDGTGRVYGVWFNQPYMRKFFKVQEKIVLYGKLERYDKLQINHPQYEVLKPDEKEDSIHVGRIVPMYHLTQDIAQRGLRSISHQAISEYSRYLVDMLPTKLRARNRLVDINFAIRNMHFPANEENLKKAHRRIIFDEFFLLQTALALKKNRVKTKSDGVRHVVGKGLAEEFIRGLPFELTDGQKDAIEKIRADMGSSRPMNRLVQGDVGSGKTVVAAYALLLTAENGYQGALMAPTEILAEQHYVTLSNMFMKHDINIVMLAQGLDPKARADVLDDIKKGRADIIVGTHALIQESVEFKNLGLAVIDEQHKFGVYQRARLQDGQRVPDILLMTATPIPRTLAMTVYGDLDMSVIKELPPGRGDIITYWVSDSKRERIYNFLREEVSKGRQVYIVYPRLEESAASDIKAAKFMHEELKERIFKDLTVELIHGKMRPREKESIMKRFKKREISILVSTVVIEVGIDVPNASTMVVENAERFGLSQLHQLRGRIGRGQHESYCILISDAPTEVAHKRLSAMTESEDGFQIAEEDLKLRGPGDIFGTRQHGLPEVRFGNIIRDMDIMELARKEAFSVISFDPDLKNRENRFIRGVLGRRFNTAFNMAGVG
ncbi:MAG: ATP-dependent DNA helicase RecG [Candidatus Omnitrophica bacterium]|nr:ATP-dependent DNA helicase RecG [Candidatus Omnitrophota bacterium]